MMNRNPARPVLVLLFKPPQQGKLLVIRRGDDDAVAGCSAAPASACSRACAVQSQDAAEQEAAGRAVLWPPHRFDAGRRRCSLVETRRRRKRSLIAGTGRDDVRGGGASHV